MEQICQALLALYPLPDKARGVKENPVRGPQPSLFAANLRWGWCARGAIYRFPMEHPGQYIIPYVGVI